MKVSELEARVSQLGADAINLSIRIDARLDRQAERIDRVSKGLDQAAERLSQMIDAVDARLDSQAGTICKHDERLDAQAIVVARRGEQIEDLERAILEEAANVAGLGAHIENQAVNQRKRSDALHDQVCTINERLGIHVTRLDAQSSSIDSLIERDEQLERKIEKKADRAATRFEAIDERIADETFRLEGLDDDLKREHGDRLSALESELEDTTRTANSAEMEVNDAKMDVSTLEGKVDSLTADLSSLSHTVNYG